MEGLLSTLLLRWGSRNLSTSSVTSERTPPAPPPPPPPPHTHTYNKPTFAVTEDYNKVLCGCDICRCPALIDVRDKAGVLPLMAAAKAGHKSTGRGRPQLFTYLLFVVCVCAGVVNRLLYHMLKDNALVNKPNAEDEIRHCSLTALSYGFHTYFEVSACMRR